MNANPQPPSSLPRTSRLVRLLIAAAIGVAGLTILLVVAFFIENMRGKSAWDTFRTEWEAKGEEFDAASIIPAPVPAAENFAMTPLLAPLLDYDSSQPGKWRDPAGYQRATRLANPFKGDSRLKAPPLGNWETSTTVDLSVWQTFFENHAEFAGGTEAKDAPAAILAALSRFEPELDELKQASKRPTSNFPIHYDESFNALLPHLAVLKGAATLIRLRALAQLAATRPADALEDIKLGFRLAEALKSEPLLISQLVRLATLQLMVQPIWEGLARNQWNDVQLSELQYFVGGISVLESYGRAIRGERGLCNEMLRQMRTGKPPRHGIEGLPDPSMPALRFLPSGWIYQNQTAINRMYQQHLLPVIDAEQRRAFPAIAAAAENAPELKSRNPYNILAALLLPAVTKSSAKFAHQQTTLDLTVVACALERFRRDSGQYPDSLEKLAPAFMGTIPKDIISGEPLKYSRTGEGRFVLYSVGWNETDDGGESARRGKSNSSDPEQGDWAWRYPSTN